MSIARSHAGSFPSISAVVLTVALSSASAHAQAVPAPYASLYSTLKGSLDAYEATVDAAWDGRRHPVDFAAELTSASSLLGERIVDPEHFDGVLLELDSLKALGVKAVTVQFAFPVLDPAFHGSTAEYQQYLGFYERLASQIRARNLKLIARSGIVMSQQGFTTVDVRAYYESLTLAQYKSRRIQAIRTVVERFQPDYIVVVGEPDTEAAQTRKPELATVEGSTAFLDAILTAIAQTGVTGISVGAGIGTWTPHYRAFAESYLSRPIDFFDAHVYPGNRDFLTRVLELADLTHSRGKEFAVSESWLQKVAEQELGIASVLTLFAREPFSFWAPLNEQFAEVMVKTAHLKRFAFFSPFWSQYLHGYVEYNSVAYLAPTQILSVAYNSSAQQISEGQFSTTGRTYAAMIAASPDTAAPGITRGVSATPLSANAVYVSWDASTDNVGVAGYNVYRGGVPVGTTAHLFHIDTPLSPNTRYLYTVRAFDVAGRLSAPSIAIAATTTTVHDTAPPSTPAAVSGQPISAAHVELAWARSTDNVKVAGYKVFRNAVLVGWVQTTSFSDAGLAADRPYAYTVAAVDSSGNSSPLSAAAIVRTHRQDVTAPTVPTALSAIPGKAIVYLNWAPSADEGTVAGYQVFRNGAPLIQVTAPSHRDTSVASGVQYTYAVRAFDARSNLSALSTPVTITTIDITPPSAPTAFVGNAVSSTQATVSWVAATDNVGVAGYKLYRNGVFLRNWGATAYLDTGLTPETWYTYHVSAVDAMGNVSTVAGPVHIRSMAAPDTAPPSIPAGLRTVSVASNRISIAWNASSDNIETVGYKIFRNGILIGVSNTPSFVDVFVLPQMTFSYKVGVYRRVGE